MSEHGKVGIFFLRFGKWIYLFFVLLRYAVLYTILDIIWIWYSWCSEDKDRLDTLRVIYSYHTHSLSVRECVPGWHNRISLMSRLLYFLLYSLRKRKWLFLSILWNVIFRGVVVCIFLIFSRYFFVFLRVSVYLFSWFSHDYCILRILNMFILNILIYCWDTCSMYSLFLRHTSLPHVYTSSYYSQNITIPPISSTHVQPHVLNSTCVLQEEDDCQDRRARGTLHQPESEGR